jgi:hypothetical protein
MRRITRAAVALDRVIPCWRSSRATTSPPAAGHQDRGSGGTVSFAGAGYHAGWAYRRQQVQVTLVADTVQLAVAGRVIKVHPIRHENLTAEHKELGAVPQCESRVTVLPRVPTRKSRSAPRSACRTWSMYRRSQPLWDAA